MTSEPMWESIAVAGAATRGEYRVIESDVRTVWGPILFALDSQGLHHLLMPVGALLRGHSDERSSGVHILQRTLIGSIKEESFIDVMCRKPHLAPVFDHLVAEILNGVKLEPGRPATTALRVLARWREFLERGQTLLLSEDRLLGLFGELFVLREVVRITPVGINAWQGPLGARHDFRSGRLSVEVKTTTRIGFPVAVHIHGVDQLAVPDGGELIVLVIAAERIANAGESVPDLISSLLELGVDAFELSKKLRSAGYDESDRPAYIDLRFQVSSRTGLRVDDKFPRITRESFVDGHIDARVTDFRYSIAIDAKELTTLSEARISGLFASLANGGAGSGC